MLGSVYCFNMFVAGNSNRPFQSYGLYCAFHKHANFEGQKPTNDCVFRCRQSS